MPSRFNNARQAVAFAGLDPRQHESGSTRLSKVGCAFVRKALYMPAMVTAYRTDWGKRFAARLAAAGKPPMLIIVAVMRKLIHRLWRPEVRQTLQSGFAWELAGITVSTGNLRPTPVRSCRALPQ